MNVTIIYGTMIKANTYSCVQLLLNNLKLNINIEVTEFFLLKDLPYVYHEGFSNLTNNKYRSPPFNYNDFIAKSLYKTDLIILACPVSTCDITPEMKLFLNDLSCYMKNKQSSIMCNKIGLVMSTAAGAGLFHVIRILKKNLNFLGLNNIFSFSEVLYEMNFEDVNLRTRKKINVKIYKLSNKILSLYDKSQSIKSPLIHKSTFPEKKTLTKEYDCNVIDIKYCQSQVTFNGKNI